MIQRKSTTTSQIVFDINSGEPNFTTMSLQTIPNRPPLIKSAKENFNLRTDDIEGAFYTRKERQMPDFRLTTSDIEGAQTSPMVNPAKPPVDLMSVDDIDGAKPNVRKQLRKSNRMTNPLNPEYQLPSAVVIPPPVPRFIRDSISNDDIPGAHSKSYKSDKNPRDLMYIDDIPGCRPRRLVGDFQSGNRTYDVSDINKDRIHQTTRVCDPLNPVYQYDGVCAATDFGKTFQPPPRKNTPTYSLLTQDIDGATASSGTRWYRSYRPPPKTTEADELKPAPLLMLPSMTKQTRELELQEMARQMRGNKIRMCENRLLHARQGTGDSVQASLREHRETSPQRLRRPSKPTFNL
jgi:hypothetical protein